MENYEQKKVQLTIEVDEKLQDKVIAAISKIKGANVKEDGGFTSGCIDLLTLLIRNPLVKGEKGWWTKLNIGAERASWYDVDSGFTSVRGECFNQEGALEYCNSHGLQIPSLEDLEDLRLSYKAEKNVWMNSSHYNSRRFESKEGIIIPISCKLWIKDPESENLALAVFKSLNVEEKNNIVTAGVEISVEPPDDYENTYAYIHPYFI